MTGDTGPVLLPIGQDSQPPQPLTLPPGELQPGESGRIARAAAVIGIGSLASRTLGLVRETVKADLFGATGMVSALEAAIIIPTSLYNLLIGGIISSALVPVFSEYSPKGRRDDLWFLASSLMTLVALVLCAAVVFVELAASWVIRLPSGGLATEFLQTGAQMLRISMPAVVFMTLSGILTGLLFALKRFTLPAFSAVAVNACVVAAALLLGERWGVMSMAVGLLVGSVAQMLVQLIGLRDARLRPVFNFRHPGLHRMVKLYVPVMFSLVIAEVAAILSYNLASHTGEEGVAWMRYAAQLINLPLGLVATAVSFAILPTLSQQAQMARSAAADSPEQNGTSSRKEKSERNKPFLTTLAQGMKMVLVFTTPAAIGLYILAPLVVGLIFEHGDFDARDTVYTSQALRFALLGLVFAAVDWPLNFAFYAQQDTLTPAIVGLIAVGIYVVVALAPALFGPLTLNGLIFANSIQWTSHALIMLWLLNRRMGGLHGFGMPRFLVKVIVASAAMGATTWALSRTLARALLPGGLVDELAVVCVSAVIGFTVYVALMTVLRADTGALVRELLNRRHPASTS